MTMPGGTNRLHWIALTLILAVAAAHAWHRAFFIDDAYISFRYAQNLIEGKGLVFNPGERVEGYTNFSWTLLIAGAMAAGLPPVLFTQMLGIGAAMAILLILYLWSLRLGIDPAWALVAPAMLAVNRTYAAWSTGGLETRWFTLLLVAAAFRLGIERVPGAFGRRQPLSAALLGLACLTRPEGMLAAAVAGMGLVREYAGVRSPGAVRYLTGWLVTTASIVAAHLIWRHYYYGDWLPNSFAAKVPGLRLTSGAIYLGLLFLNHLVLITLVVAIHQGIIRRSLREDLGLLAGSLFGFVVPFCALYTLYLFVIGGDHFEFRLADPIIPFLFLGAVTLVARPLRGPVRGWAAMTTAGLMVLSAGISSFVGFSDFDRHIPIAGNTEYVSIVSVETEAGFLKRWERIGRWLAHNAGPRESIGVRPAGAIPYLSGMRTLDMLGINDREIARLPIRPGQNIGHERYVDDDYVRWRGLTYMIGSPEIHLEKPVVVGHQVIEVDFGDFWWYFWPLQPDATIRPGSRMAAGGG